MAYRIAIPGWQQIQKCTKYMVVKTFTKKNRDANKGDLGKLRRKSS